MFSTKVVIGIIIYLIIGQIVLSFLWSEWVMIQILLIILTTNCGALFLVAWGYRRIDLGAQYAKDTLLTELGLSNEDIKIYKDKFLPLLRRMAKMDIEKTSRAIDKAINFLEEREEWL